MELSPVDVFTSDMQFETAELADLQLKPSTWPCIDKHKGKGETTSFLLYIPTLHQIAQISSDAKENP